MQSNVWQSDGVLEWVVSGVMVTCRVDSATYIKMNRRSNGSMASTSSGFRLLDDQNNNNFDTISSISRNSIYKQKIDLMFDDSRYVIGNFKSFLSDDVTILFLLLILRHINLNFITFRCFFHYLTILKSIIVTATEWHNQWMTGYSTHQDTILLQSTSTNLKWSTE